MEKTTEMMLCLTAGIILGLLIDWLKTKINIKRGWNYL